MLSPLITPVISLIASASTSIAAEGLVKTLTPTDIKTVPGFTLKVGTAVVGGLIAAKIGAIVAENVKSVIDTVNEKESGIVDAEEVQED